MCIRDSPGETVRQSGHTHTHTNTEETGPGGRCERASQSAHTAAQEPPPRALRADSHPFPTILKSSLDRALCICHRSFLTQQQLEQVSVATEQAWVCMGDESQVEWPRTVGEGKGWRVEDSGPARVRIRVSESKGEAREGGRVAVPPLPQPTFIVRLPLGSGLQFPQLSPARLSVFSSVLFSPAPRPGLLPQPAS